MTEGGSAGESRRIVYLIAVMTVVALTVGGLAIGTLYDAAFEEQRQRLIETAQSRARLMEAVARFDAVYSQDYPHGARQATISQVVDAHDNFKGFGETGEFTLAERRGSEIVYLLRHRHRHDDQPLTLPFATTLAEPMRQALGGRSGTLVGLDYRGVEVLAAFEPVDVLDLGIVAKIDLAEIRAPFVRAALVALGLALIVVVIGSVLFLAASNPIIRRMRESEERYRSLVDAAPDAILLVADDRVGFANAAAARIFGAAGPSDLIGLAADDLLHPDCRDLGRQRRQLMIDGKRQMPATELTGLRLDGTTFAWESVATYLTWQGRPAMQALIRDVSERKQADEALRRSERELADKSRILETTFESIDQGFVVWDDEQRLVAWNEKCLEFWYHPQHIVRPGMKMLELLRHIAGQGGFGAGEPQAAAEREFARIRHAGPQSQDRFIMLDGTIVRVDRYLMPGGGHVATYTDISESTRAEAELKQARDDLELRVAQRTEALSTANLALAEAQRLARIGNWERSVESDRFTWSDELYRIFGFEPGEIEPTVDLTQEMIHPDDRELGTDLIERVLGSGQDIHEHDFRFTDARGRPGVAHSRVQLIRDQAGRPLKYVGTIQDISERKQAETEVVAARERAEYADRAKSEFLANMSHELRTPLNAIMGFAQLIMAGNFGPLGDARYEEYTSNIYHSGEHLLLLINDILDLSKIEAGQTELYEVEVDPARTIEDCLRLVATDAEKAGLEIEADISPRPPTLRADERMVKQMLLNLLSNSVKFTQRGGRITVDSGLRADGALELSVSDTGIGIADEDMPRALATFGQVESSLNRRFDGTGLGLPLVRSLAELHNGGLDISSQPGVGTKVTIWFPKDRVMAG
ncbi:MAG TPA: PAS domain S-box protein [Alphaproteobacteria bacterium]|nr:PAS domain S-box protein [Alphaproteobacteria bacterium]MDP7426675.1 PAS domain S-box protein [Alphaproteobacteria bacterium]HJM49146.1 PAS domain S-box protein [Alphaproteobacteria bacterium]